MSRRKYPEHWVINFWVLLRIDLYLLDPGAILEDLLIRKCSKFLIFMGTLFCCEGKSFSLSDEQTFSCLELEMEDALRDGNQDRVLEVLQMCSTLDRPKLANLALTSLLMHNDADPKADMDVTLITTLLKHGADPSAVCHEYVLELAVFFQSVSTKGFLLLTDKYCPPYTAHVFTPLDVAIAYRKKEKLDILWSRCKDSMTVDDQTKVLSYCLSCAITYSHLEMVKYFVNECDKDKLPGVVGDN